MSGHYVYGYIFTSAAIVEYARRNGLDKQFPNSNDLMTDLAEAAINDMIKRADASSYARFSVAKQGKKWYHCLALYSNTPEQDYFSYKPTKDVVMRVAATVGVSEVPKWYKCPL